MAGPDDLQPAEPEEVGVPERRPPDSRIEGAHVLASEARGALEPHGFSERQILEWAEAFIAEEGNGDVEGFVDWVRAREQDA